MTNKWEPLTTPDIYCRQKRHTRRCLKLCRISSVPNKMLYRQIVMCESWEIMFLQGYYEYHCKKAKILAERRMLERAISRYSLK
jgi:hypothetical protein